MILFLTIVTLKPFRTTYPNSKIAKIDQEIKRVQLFIEQLELFKKVTKDNTEDMVIEMKTQQQLAVQELEESFTVLLSMMNDAQHYIDAKQEVEHKMLE